MKKLRWPAGAALVLALAGGASAQTVLKIGYVTPLASHMGAGAQAFCAHVEQGTQGRYTCQQFPSGALGGEREQIEAVQLGTQDLVNTSSGPLGNFVPETRILDVPFLIRDYDHAYKVLDGEIGQEILAKFPAKGMIALAWTDNGFRHLTNSRRAVVTPADAAGLKIRTMENRVHMDGYKAFGITPTPMAFTEVFTALQQGTVDGQENPIPVILAARLAQVQKHLSLTSHVYSPAALLLSPAVWNKLSDADKEVFREAGRQAAVAQRKKVADDEAVGVQTLEREGMSVERNVDREAFRAALAPAYKQYARQFGQDNLDRITAVR